MLALPAPRPDIERVTSLPVLGVIVNDKLTAADNVTMLLSSRSSLLYAMQVLRSHGTLTTSLHDIFRAIVVSRIEYAAPACSGMSSATDRARLNSLLRRGKRLGYCSAVMTCRPSPNCLTQPTMTSSTASKPSLHTSSTALSS